MVDIGFNIHCSKDEFGSGFRYNHLFNGGKYDNRQLLYAKYHNCPISKLKSIYFKGKKQKEIMGIESRYKTKRKNFRDAF